MKLIALTILSLSSLRRQGSSRWIPAFAGMTLVILLLTLHASTVRASDSVIEVNGEPEYVSSDDRKLGFFVGAGPELGFDMSGLSQVGGGLATEFGYLFKNGVAIMLAADGYYTHDRRVNYFMFPIMPKIKYTFDTNFFCYAGGGYTLMWAGRGTKWGSATSTAGKIYNGFSVAGGAGYDLWYLKKLVISPEVGLDYTRLAGNNIIMPIVKVYFNWFF